LPAAPSRESIHDLQGLAGNEQVLRIHEQRTSLLEQATAWKAIAEKKATRLAAWDLLHDLLQHLEDGPDRSSAEAQVTAIRSGRSLLEDPDPVGPLLIAVAELLRARYTGAQSAYSQALGKALASLAADELWLKLTEGQRTGILDAAGLNGQAGAGVETTQKLLAALRETTPREWDDRVDALPERAAKARETAAKLLEPEAVRITLPSATIRTADDLDRYLAELREAIEAKLGGGPVVL
jgi:hypothetical protein